MAEPRSEVVFQERLGPGVGLWGAGVVVAGAIAIAYGSILGPTAGFVVALVGAGVLIGLSFAFNRRTVLTGTSLKVGSETVALDKVTGVEALDPQRARAVAGPEADARARFVLRTGKPAVRVTLDDTRCPYWLVSSNRPDELAEAITRLTQRPADEAGTMGA